MEYNSPTLVIGKDGGTLKAVPGSIVASEFGVYATGTKMLYLPGTRYSPDERSFVYCKNEGTNSCIPGYGVAAKLAYLDVDAGLNKAIVVGDTSFYVAVDAGTATAFGTADRMKGGYINLPTGTITNFRRIIDHQTGSSGAVVRCDVDGPFTQAYAAAAFTELMGNPYWSVGYPQEENANYSAKLGIPTTTIAASSYGWIQHGDHVGAFQHFPWPTLPTEELFTSVVVDNLLVLTTLLLAMVSRSLVFALTLLLVELTTHRLYFCKSVDKFNLWGVGFGLPLLF